MIKMNIRRFISAALAVTAVIAVFSSCSVSDGTESTSADAANTTSETKILSAGEKGFAYQCRETAEKELSAISFDSAVQTDVQNPAYSKCVCLTDSVGNVRYNGYDENGELVFYSVQLYKDGGEYMYAEYKNGEMTVLSEETDSGTLFFTFSDGKLDEYTLSTGKDGYNKEIRHFNDSGLIKTEIFDSDGNKIAEN